MRLNFLQKILITSLLILVLAAHACSRPNSDEPAPASTSATQPTATPIPTPTPSPTPINPRALLEASGQAMASLDAFSFRIEHEEGGTPLAQGLILDEAEGSIVRPNKLSIDFAGRAGNFAIKGSLISIGDTSYMTNPLNGNWEPVPSEVSPLGFFNPNQGIAAMMTQVKQVNLQSKDKDEYIVVGVIEPTALASLFGETITDSFVSLRLTLDTKTLYLKEVTLEGRITPTEPVGITRIITLSDFNDPITIETPQ